MTIKVSRNADTKCRGKILETTRQWRDHKDLDRNCMRGATWKINKKNYCTTHAGKILLDIAVEEEEWVPAKK